MLTGDGDRSLARALGRCAPLGHGPAPKIDVTRVIDRGLPHVSWPAHDDPVISEAPSDGWKAVLIGRTPEAFRALGPSFVVSSR